MGEEQIGEVSDYFAHVEAAAVKLTAPLRVGDIIRMKGGETIFEQKVESMQIDRVQVQSAKKGDEVGIKMKQKVHKGCKVFRV